MARAVERRRHQFSTGRWLAHRLLEEAGAPCAPLLSGEDRAPLWPRGITGSISHCESTAVVAIASSRRVRAVGVDVEEASPLAGNLHAMVLTAREESWLRTHPAEDRGRLAKLLFSAKEAAYKAQATLSHTMLEFKEVRLEVDLETASFVAHLPERVHEAVGEFELRGRWSMDHRVVLTGTVLAVEG